VRRSSYRIAYFKDKDADFPALVPLDIEEETNPVTFLRKNALGRTHEDVVELVVVPLSQIGPGCEKICRGCAECTASRLPGSTKTTTYYHDGTIKTTKTNAVARIGSSLDASEIAF